MICGMHTHQQPHNHHHHHHHCHRNHVRSDLLGLVSWVDHVWMVSWYDCFIYDHIRFVDKNILFTVDTPDPLAERLHCQRIETHYKEYTNVHFPRIKKVTIILFVFRGESAYMYIPRCLAHQTFSVIPIFVTRTKENG